MTITIYHNPRCSKSREAFSILEKFAADNSISLNVIEYLKTPPSRDQLLALSKSLGGNLRDMVRSNEDEYVALELAKANNDVLLDALASHPKLLQRPVVVYRGKALIARPPELLQDFLKP
ncbi:MAG TPA: arsenate reductase (glutaredoxin) [Noviherbaspirillum sp.]